ncbi:SDR family NAD(P)-dependent oxidoreductase [Sulfidibacter corallicola]|uniref:SDR family NAD(P)-dependent oxidoreductase n=1 Tax=Sulfidibacter corallicola TaxID=2818388 RepID=A0A8A4TPT2_SULCO|nr:SDR family NAD(P)-dependent oxidoreductase [Sulfidibacter corallicola]QTD51204.1 SDR family NAD(P)-dependent oxidoreductase [Sulfidibacter corallicola]
MSTSLSPEDAPTHRSFDEVLQSILRTIADIQQVAEIEADCDFSKINLSSVQSVSFAEQLNQRWSLTLGPEIVFDFRGPKQLAEHLAVSNAHEFETETEPVAVVSAGGEGREAPQGPPANRPTLSNQPIAVIGMAARFADAPDIHRFWDNLAAGKSSIKTVDRHGWSKDKWHDTDRSRINCSYSASAGLLDQIDHFDPLFFNISPQEAERMDPQQRLMLEESYHAFEDAGLAVNQLAGKRIGVYIGARTSDYRDKTLLAREIESKTFLGTDNAILAGRLSYCFDFRGPSMAVDTACSASLVAVHQALTALQNGEAEMALAGGVFLMPSPEFLVMAAKTEMLSPSGRCHSFDRAADGIAVGEGVAALVLKPLSAALADGDPIRGLIRATAINGDGHTTGITAPSGPAQRALLLDAWSRAGIFPEDLTYLEAHGTGTKLGDPIEFKALCDAFRNQTDRKHFCFLGSHKANIGHTIMTAGIAGMIKVLLMMEHRTIPPSAGYQNPNPHLNLAGSPFLISNGCRRWFPEGGGPRLAGISSFGFSGTNAHAVLQEAPTDPRAQPREQAAYLFVFSAKTPEAVLAQVQGLADWLAAPTNGDLHPADVATTLLCGRDHFNQRLTIIAKDLTELKHHLMQAKQSDICKIRRDGTHDPQAFAELCAAHGEKRSLTALRNDLKRLAEWYRQGAQLDWSRYAAGWKGRRISLPGYAFARERYWIEGFDPLATLRLQANPETGGAPTPPIARREDSIGATNEHHRPIAGEKNPMAQIGLFQTKWRPFPTSNEQTCLPTGCALLGVRDQSLTDLTAATTLRPYHNLEEVMQCPYSQQLIWFVTPKIEGTEPANAAIDAALDLMADLRRLLTAPRHIIHRILLVTQSEQSGSPFAQSVAALSRVVHREEPNLALSSLELCANDPRDITAALSATLEQRQALTLRFERGQLYHATFAPAELPSAAPMPGAARPPVWLVSGGCGALGSGISQHLSRQGKVQLALLGHSPLGPRQQDQLDRLQALGAIARYYSVDLGDAHATRQAVHAVKRDFGGIDVVLHAAGTIDDRYLVQFERERAARVLRAKIAAAHHLDEACEDQELKAFVCMSSVSAVLGNQGQADYAFANGYLDGFAQQRRRLGRCGLSLSLAWPYWQDGGMQLDPQTFASRFASSGMEPMGTESGCALLDRLLQGDTRSAAHWIINHGDQQRFTAHLALAERLESPTPEAQEAAHPSANEGATTRAAVAEMLISLFSKLLKLPRNRIETDIPFKDYGIDSILVNRFNEAVSRYLPEDFSRTLLYRFETLDLLTDHLTQRYGNRLQLPETGTNAGAHRPAAIDQAGDDSGTPREPLPPPTGPIRASRDSDGTPTQPIAIIGLAGRYPKSPDLDSLWSRLENGETCIDEVPRDRWDAEAWFDADPERAREGKIYCRWGGYLDQITRFDPLFFNIAPSEAETMDPQERLFLETCWAAIEDAATTPAQLKGAAKDRPNRVGVFAGVTNYGFALQGPAHWQSGKSTIPISLPWSLANRISYVFGFQGPSLPVDTACSSSLTAIQMACRSLQQGECDTALAGGVNLFLHPTKYLWMCQKRMLSPSGVCRPFGAGADGFVPGEGVGVVLLKPLADAQRDGDPIHGVILAGAINHGGNTNGYMVPNPNAQAALVRTCLHQAALDPTQIGYVEAHGTGTALGDPIEIEALSRVYGSPSAERKPCPIGSVKANIGHLEAAAGIAGVTKILLQFRHRRLVPSLNATQANPNIAFEHTPFRVQQKSQAWSRQQNEQGQPLPYRAAVSSFGAGGVNAHLILESYQAPDRANPADQAFGPQVIVLSATRPQQLTELAIQLATFLDKSSQAPDDDRPCLADVAFTLQIGRVHHRHRLALVANGLNQTTAILRRFAENPDNADGLWCDDSRTGPAQGFQLKGRPGALYVQALAEEGDLPQLAQIWVLGADVDWHLLHHNHTPRRIVLPTYPFAGKAMPMAEPMAPIAPPAKATQPTNRLHPLSQHNRATFERFECLCNCPLDASLLADHLVQGRITLPGVAYLELARAAGAIATRQPIRRFSRVFWTQPLQPRLPSSEIWTRLEPHNGSLSFTIVTADSAGEEISHVQGRLHRDRPQTIAPLHLKGIAARLPHRQSAARVYTAFAAQGLNYGPSFQTIQELGHSEDEALARITRADALPGTVTDPGGDFLEPTLLDGALQVTACLAPVQNGDPAPYIPFSLGELRIHRKLQGALWVYSRRTAVGRGMLTFDLILADDEGRVVAEFVQFSARRLTPSIRPSTAPQSPLGAEVTLFDEAWLPAHPTVADRFQPAILLFDEAGPLWKQCQQWPNALLVQPGACFRQLDAQRFELDPTSIEDYGELLRHLIQSDRLPHRFIHAWPLRWHEEIGTAPPRAVSACFAFAAALAKIRLDRRIDWRVFYDGQTKSGLACAALSGFLQSVHREIPRLKTSLTAVDRNRPDLQWGEVSATDDDATEIRYRGGVREIKQYRRRPLETRTWQAEPGTLWLISGGMGGLGQLFSHRLAAQGARLALLGRSPRGTEIEHTEQRLGQLGGETHYYRCDLRDRSQVQTVLAEIFRRQGPIEGVIHAAGVTHDSRLADKTLAQWRHVYAPKVEGVLNLDAALGNRHLKHFILFSSIAGLLGNIGQSDYAYANRFLDHFAAWRNRESAAGRRFGVTQSIAWPLWAEGGMGIDAETEAWLEKKFGLRSLDSTNGLLVFDALLASQAPLTGVICGEREQLCRIYDIHCDQLSARATNHQEGTDQPLGPDEANANPNHPSQHQGRSVLAGAGDPSAQASRSGLAPLPEPAERQGETSHGSPPGGRIADKLDRLQLLADLTELCMAVLKVDAEDIDTEESLEQYGLDSIMMMTLLNRIEERWGLVLEPSLFVELSTLSSLADHLYDSVPNLIASNPVPSTQQSEVPEKDRTPPPDPPPTNLEDDQRSTPSSKFSELLNTAPESIDQDPSSDSHQPTGHNPVARYNAPREARDIAVIGLACRLPGANNAERFIELLQAGKSAVTEVPADRWSIAEYYAPQKNQPGRTYAKWAALLDDIYGFDAEYFAIDHREAAVLDPHHRLILEIAAATLCHAGYDKIEIAKTRTAVYIAGGESDYLRHRWHELPDWAHKRLVVNSIPNMMAARIADFYDLQGAAQVIDTACSSSLVAVHQAVSALRQGECDAALAGGVELHIGPYSHLKFAAAGVLAASPQTRVFDRDADGFVLGEGAGMVMLKRADRARADGDRILALIRGSAVNNDGHTMGLTVPNGEAQTKVIRAALADSGVDPADIHYLEAHGTGTSLGDPIEVRAATHAYGRTAARATCAIGSLKSNIGHLLRAAGIASLIKNVLILQQDLIPATLHCLQPHPRFRFQDSPFYPVLEATPWPERSQPRRAAISSFGFGGTNCHLILEQVLPTANARQPLPAPAFQRRNHDLFAPTDSDLDDLLHDGVALRRWLEDLAGTALLRPEDQADAATVRPKRETHVTANRKDP